MAASNIFHTSGRRWLGQIINGVASLPTNLYLGLRKCDGAGGAPADAAVADTLTSNLSEISGAGYTAAASPGRKTITRNNANFVESLSGADSLMTVASQTFTFGSAGTVTGITHAFLATTADNAGALIASAALGTTRNVTGTTDQIVEVFTFTLTTGV